MCPVCSANDWVEVVSAEVLRMEGLLRTQFVYDRVPRPPAPEERKDLTDFAHHSAATILQCRSCCALMRNEAQQPVETYAEDPYDTAVMERMMPRYAAAFAAKEMPYRSMLRANAKVLEIGPHLGGFLKTAGEWGWDATGVDVGKATTTFLNEHGLKTTCGTLDSCHYNDGQFDGIFIWNCFEQVPEPVSLIAECRLLQPEGLLVLRVPNAFFYLQCGEYLAASGNPELVTWTTRALAYSNLLGWPYLHGYNGRLLDRLTLNRGFRRVAALNSELIVLPFPDLPEWVLEEKRAALALVESLQDFEDVELRGSWIELSYRAIK